MDILINELIKPPRERRGGGGTNTSQCKWKNPNAATCTLYYDTSYLINV